MRVLILAGSAEARELGQLIDPRRHEVTLSFAGLTEAPAPHAGRRRIGGFGGADGLARHLATEGIDALIDATHPFAAGISANAVAAARRAGVPLLRLSRAEWPWRPGWERAASLAEAAAMIAPAARVFLTTGRRSFPAFAARQDVFFLARAAEAGANPFARGEVVTGLPPFSEESERALIDRWRLDTLVTRNSGGPAAKLDAAGALGLRVIVIARPELPAAREVHSVEEALGWLDALEAPAARPMR
ncbi:MAG: cobalt-precorrin-6A reductase [Alphaproteobacteria bacterium]|nr:MAG: cobalt-precorrin-6A reductase [Alphaproteobacteria bacterium]